MTSVPSVVPPPAPAGRVPLPFTKGHGTQNDFVLLADPEGTLDLDASLVRLLCDRRAGLGADGVIRVVPTAAAAEESVRAQAGRARWFMDYRNADGSVAEMCGNGARVFAAYLRREGLETAAEFAIATRAGTRAIRVDDAADDVRVSVHMGSWRITAPERFAERGFDTLVALRSEDPWPGLSFDLGNPHVVVALPESVDLDALDLSFAPALNPTPETGANVEFVQPLGPGHLRMRVHERGVGETRSCGTGACAAALALRAWSGRPADHEDWRVDLPGGTVYVTVLPGDQVELTGPAELVADGTFWLARDGMAP